MSMLRSIEPSRNERDGAQQSIVSAKTHLLSWAHDHDARSKGPWPVIGAMAAGGVVVLLARAALFPRSASKTGGRGAQSLVSRIARPVMRVAVAGRMAYWLWNRVGGQTHSAMGLARGSRTTNRNGVVSDLPAHPR